MRFRPCIDLHQGKVKQIVGGSLSDHDADAVRTNFESTRSAEWYARRYRRDGLTGGHIIQLGSGNQDAARAALAAWPGGMQLGGGVTADNAVQWLDAGAAAVIVTSWVFYNGRVDMQRLKHLTDRIGPRQLVLDLSCRRKENEYYVVTDRWQTFTREKVTHELLDRLAPYCCEYLIHAVDVEGRCQGIETALVELLGHWDGLPVTYAGGIHNQAAIDTIGRLGCGRIDFTVGSALDIFGGCRLRYSELALQYSGRDVGD
ncbi:MAG: phosphoribosylformimino-5-aminoimidazole carboxamide ribotide isomerase [Desulfatitalea sp.]|nr:phosphoribosylformimino-5-aminoimidazole carboxamide ribotide isomerase [Desulfatitalea sp.]NNJ99895.1 phosphoribosylformimino-5-aminoimidazole carboxamide ribotide isomerase [Desulfatitalea sp.]